ncbi:MAG: 30S ribosomal protein S2 [Nitrospinae bacterium]|nr:30S ribosomal protein S2 [Nitrospinota bacterium]
MQEVNMRELLEAGAHFGHQTKRWNPKMKPYIFGSRNKIYIIDLSQTVKLANAALKFVTEAVAKGQKVLFVGTKKQARDIVAEEANRCGMYYINKRWLGGTLTNFATICKSTGRLKELDTMKESGVFSVLHKKEALTLEREAERLDRFFGGIKNMTSIPEIIFIIDIKKEKIALQEGQRMGSKLIAMVDTNCDPENVDYVIPSNDDAVRAIQYLSSQIANAVLEGQTILEIKRKAKEEEEAKEKEKKAQLDRAIKEAKDKEREKVAAAKKAEDDQKKTLKPKEKEEKSKEGGEKHVKTVAPTKTLTKKSAAPVKKAAAATKTTPKKTIAKKVVTKKEDKKGDK